MLRAIFTWSFDSDRRVIGRMKCRHSHSKLVDFIQKILWMTRAIGRKIFS